MNDFSKSYITFEHDGQKLESSTITLPLNSTYRVTVKSQSNRQSKPRFYKQIDDQQIIDINRSNELKLRNQTYGNGYREVRDLDMTLDEKEYATTNTIRYIVRIGDRNKGEITKLLYVKIE